MKQIPHTFECEPYGDFKPITPLISKGRLKIYYLGKNRNMSYITESFSNKLQQYLPYVPIVGIYDKTIKDFQGHNIDRNVANTYGLVPENPNASWEHFLDNDGVERDYLCCDVYLYTGRYDAAKSIIGKAHSMELNTNSIQGYWHSIDGEDYFEYTDGYFDGFCVLGDRVEPCFEGSGFFEKKDSIITLLEKYVKTKFNFDNFTTTIKEDNTNMDNEVMLDMQREEVAVDASAVSEVTENFGQVVVKEGEEEAPSIDIADSVLEEEVVETPAEEVSVEESSGSETEFEDGENADSKSEVDEAPQDSSLIADEEGTPLEVCQTLTANASFEEICKNFVAANEYFANTLNKISELQTKINTLNIEMSTMREKLEEYQATELEASRNEKFALLSSYSEMVSVEILNNLKEHMDCYTLEGLEKEILFSFKKEHPNFFKHEEEPVAFSSIRTKEEGGIVGILNKYKNK